MSFSANVTQAWTSGGTAISTSKTYTSTARIGIAEAVNTGVTDQLIALVLDVSTAVAIILTSDVAMTIEFNNSTTGVPTIVLVADVPFIETTDSYYVKLLIGQTDITQMFASNASGTNGTVQFEAIYDSTP